jgi:hypothetical protein
LLLIGMEEQGEGRRGGAHQRERGEAGVGGSSLEHSAGDRRRREGDRREEDRDRREVASRMK